MRKSYRRPKIKNKIKIEFCPPGVEIAFFMGFFERKKNFNSGVEHHFAVFGSKFAVFNAALGTAFSSALPA